MFSRINMKYGVLITSAITIALSLTAIAFILRPQVTQASQARSSMRTLFENLQKRIDEEEGFLVAIGFATPLIDDEAVWVVPDYRNEADDEISIVISEVADEYVCFDTLRGAARFIECTPYSNIANVGYLVN